MSTVFIGGSRHVSRLPAEVKYRLDNVINNKHHVIVGDANGVDKAVQKYFFDSAYNNVTIFCSGDRSRNNLGQWPTHKVSAPKNVKGFQFYAMKDREMARKADFGLMIWDGKSPGTVLNVLRLVRAGKVAVLFTAQNKGTINIKTTADWETFLSRCSGELRRGLQERATPDEWPQEQQPSFLDMPVKNEGEGETKSASPLPENLFNQESIEQLNIALATADTTTIVNVLGNIAKARGMSEVARDTGLAREALYRALSSSGNPEFATVLKVLSSIGLHLMASPVRQVERGVQQNFQKFPSTLP